MSEMHPAVAGRQRELAGLADVVRRLVEYSVTSRASADELSAIVATLEAGADRLAAHVPEGRPMVTWMDAVGTRPPDGDEVIRGGMSEHMAFDVVIGRYSPLALPVRLEFEPPRAVGRGTFTAPYEGPPGCIHGAVIAATFDIVLTAANMLAGAAGPTVRLATRFRRPTLLYEEAVFEAWVDRREGARTFTTGRLVQDGVVTVEAEGEFAAIDPRRVRGMAQRRSRSETGGG
jgi:acyl-coenzyme A thioesterase PaaI-like protein